MFQSEQKLFAFDTIFNLFLMGQKTSTLKHEGAKYFLNYFLGDIH